MDVIFISECCAAPTGKLLRRFETICYFQIQGQAVTLLGLIEPHKTILAPLKSQ
jgi:hypothetical protein